LEETGQDDGEEETLVSSDLLNGCETDDSEPAAGPLTLTWEPESRPTTTPPTMPETMPPNSGAPEPRGDPKAQGQGNEVDHETRRTVLGETT